MIKQILFATVAASPVFAFAGSLVMKGHVVDATDASALPGARIMTYMPADSASTAVIAVSDADGNFRIGQKKPGRYNVEVSFTGMRKYLSNVNLENAEQEYDLGTIPLWGDSESLDEVVITARRPVIQADGEKVTYNVGDDAESGTKTVIEMLRKVPMVTVDGQDNIKVNGQSDFKIYLNGRPDPMLSQNASTVLKAMPASAIKKIEVIMEPGAKYDAEGVGGILNIITESKKPNEGYLATLNLGGSNNNANAGVFAQSKVGKVTGSVNVNYYNSRFNPMEITGNIVRESTVPGSKESSRQDLYMKNYNDFINGSATFAWEPNEKNLFNASVSLMKGAGTQKITTLGKNYGISGALMSEYRQKESNFWDWGNVNVLASYQHTFSQAQNLVLSYQYAHGISKSKDKVFTEGIQNYDEAFPASLYDSENPSNEHTIQGDYTLQFLSDYTLETGAKGVFRRNKGNGCYLFGETIDNLFPAENPELTDVDMRQNQDVGAVYASLAGKWNAYSAKAGVRYEHTRTHVEFLKGDTGDFSSYLNDVVPNAALAYNFTPMHSLRLAYQMRIRRPSISELNPFVQYMLADIMRKGNPDLDSEKTHNVSLTYTNFIGFMNINLVASYRFSDNLISSFMYLDNDLIYSTYENSGKYNEGSLSAYIGFRFGTNLTFDVNGAVRYRDFSYKAAGISNNGWEGNFGANLNWTMPAKIVLGAYGGVSTPSVDLQGKNGGFSYYGLSLSRSFLKDDRLKISLNANNFIDTKIRINNNVTGEGFRMRTHLAATAWNVGASVSYTFGNFNAGLKRTSKSIVNDDVEKSQSGGNSFTGGGR